LGLDGMFSQVKDVRRQVLTFRGDLREQALVAGLATG
jgi:hypothetical protein